MVFFTSYVSAAAFFIGLVASAPMPKPDSAIGAEEPVSAPNGIPESSTIMANAQATAYGSSGNYGSSGDYSGGSYMSSQASYPMYTSTSTAAMMESTSTMKEATYTSSAVSSYSTPSYGSGSSSWGGSGYDSCVQQCMASYGSMGSYSPPPATTTTDSMNGSSGSGATHTVIVAPTQGVLRYVPFAVNASVGDTVLFMWGANNHTVTKSSQLEICNKTSDAPFATGEQNMGFTFTQVVNDTNTTFFYCGTPGHCEKGMFGMINPPNVGTGQLGSVAQTLPTMMSNSSSMTAMQAYANMMTANNTAAAEWGSAMDMTNIPDWAQESFAENVLFTRTFLAANPEALNADGSVSLGNLGSNPVMIPQDITQAAAQAAESSSSSVVAPSATASAASAGSTAASNTSAKNTNGARSLGSSGFLVVAIAFLSAFVVL